MASFLVSLTCTAEYNGAFNSQYTQLQNPGLIYAQVKAQYKYKSKRVRRNGSSIKDIMPGPKNLLVLK